MSKRKPRHHYATAKYPTKVIILPRFDAEEDNYMQFQKETVLVTPNKVIDKDTETERWEYPHEALARIEKLAEARVAQLNIEYKTSNGFYILKKGIRTSRKVKNY